MLLPTKKKLLHCSCNVVNPLTDYYCLHILPQLAHNLLPWVDGHSHLTVKHSSDTMHYVHMPIDLYYNCFLDNNNHNLVDTLSSRQADTTGGELEAGVIPHKFQLQNRIPRHVACMFLAFFECSYYNLHLVSVLP